jgi:hypothetical protein
MMNLNQYNKIFYLIVYGFFKLFICVVHGCITYICGACMVSAFFVSCHMCSCIENI